MNKPHGPVPIRLGAHRSRRPHRWVLCFLMYSLEGGGYPYIRQTLVASSLGDAGGGEPRREPDLPGGERDRSGGVGRQDGGPAGTRLLLDYTHGRLPSSPYFNIAARFARSVRPPFGGPGLFCARFLCTQRGISRLRKQRVPDRGLTAIHRGAWKDPFGRSQLQAINFAIKCRISRSLGEKCRILLPGLLKPSSGRQGPPVKRSKFAPPRSSWYLTCLPRRATISLIRATRHGSA